MELKNRYLIMRHGESMANLEGLIAGDAAAGTARYGLTEEGRRQATESALGCVDIGMLTAIRSSDFLRARETAEIVSFLTGATVTESELLRERYFGSFEGQPDSRYAEIWERDRLDGNNCQGGVESPAAVAERMTREIAACESEYREGLILLVSHGDPLQILEVVARGIGPERHRSIPPLAHGELRRLEADAAFLS
ncbi:MAG: histidine phosphatase family protein [Spirochaetes bacterium]|nr:histidine phosphatase family protein [Spirochaetota bacterium]